MMHDAVEIKETGQRHFLVVQNCPGFWIFVITDASIVRIETWFLVEIIKPDLITSYDDIRKF